MKNDQCKMWWIIYFQTCTLWNWVCIMIMQACLGTFEVKLNSKQPKHILSCEEGVLLKWNSLPKIQSSFLLNSDGRKLEEKQLRTKSSNFLYSFNRESLSQHFCKYSVFSKIPEYLCRHCQFQNPFSRL